MFSGEQLSLVQHLVVKFGFTSLVRFKAVYQTGLKIVLNWPNHTGLLQICITLNNFFFSFTFFPIFKQVPIYFSCFGEYCDGVVVTW